ncbi:DRTGG domain-containing protein, partial [Mycobacterium avium]|uniref:DRTGG domain-containing protein n=1 Tax=Mycobacterium avium TaxID=1764 RepID=UPI000B1AAA35
TELEKAVAGSPVSGEESLREREVTGILVAGMTADHVLERLADGMAVITPGDRSDVVLAVASAHAAEGFPSLSCIVLNGGVALHPSHAAPVVGLRPPLPILSPPPGPHRHARPGGPGPRGVARHPPPPADRDGRQSRCV